MESGLDGPSSVAGSMIVQNRGSAERRPPITTAEDLRSWRQMSKSDNPRERLARFLTGFWEYECHTDENSPPFDGGEVGRGGRIKITASDETVCVDARVEAFRLWTLERASDGAETRAPLKRFVQWQTKDGVIWVREGKVFFFYSASGGDGDGLTSDTYELRPESLVIQIGRFEHWRKDGKKVTGSVELKPMASWKSFTIAPPGCIIPPEVVKSDRVFHAPETSGGSNMPSKPPTVIDIRDNKGNIVVASGDSASVNHSLNDASIQLKSIESPDLREAIEAVLRDAEDSPNLVPTQRGFVADAIKDLVVELKSPTKDKARAMKWVDAAGVFLTGATSVVTLAEKVKSLFC